MWERRVLATAAPFLGLALLATLLILPRPLFALTFAPAQSYPSGGTTASSVTVADFDRDGHPDIAVGNYGTGMSGNVSMLWNDGTGQFEPAQLFGVGIDGVVASVASGDLDEDGNPDLVESSGGGIRVFWGTGTRVPGPVQDISSNYVFFLKVMDFDRDGDLEILATQTFNDRIEVFHPTTQRTFTSAPIPTDGYPGQFAVGGLDELYGDDIALTTADAFNLVLRLVFATQAGGFGTPVTRPGGMAPAGIVIGEFTGDDHPDILYTRRGDCSADVTTTCQNDGVTVLAGDGVGGFVDGPSMDAGEGPSSASNADLDGNGRDDVAISNFSDNRVSVFLGQPGGGFLPVTHLQVGEGPNPNTIADVNHDGCADIVVPNWRSSSVSVVLVTGCALPTPTETPTETATPPTPTKTGTATRTTTRTRTPTGTKTVTQTRTPTRTKSATKTPSITRTAAPSRTPTPSLAPTSTRTQTFTRTASRTRTPTRTLTPKPATRTPTPACATSCCTFGEGPGVVCVEYTASAALLQDYASQCSGDGGVISAGACSACAQALKIADSACP